MSRGRSQRGYAPALVVFSLTGGVFVHLVAYCVAGWWGVAGLAAVVGVISLMLHSEIAASAERQRRADEQWARYHAAYGAAPQHRSRQRRGGTR